MAFAVPLIAAALSAGTSLYGAHQQKKAQRRADRSGGSLSALGTPGRAKGYDVFSTLNPQQSSILQQLLGSMSGQEGNIQRNPLYQAGQSHIQNILGGNTEAFEAPLMRKFQEEIIPQLAERFSGAGAGAQSSSAFQNALSSSGADLAERLGALRGGLQQQAAGQALNYAQQPVSNLQNLLGMNTMAFAPKVPGFGQQLGLGIGGGLSKGFGQAIGSSDWLSDFIKNLFSGGSSAAQVGGL